MKKIYEREDFRIVEAWILGFFIAHKKVIKKGSMEYVYYLTKNIKLETASGSNSMDIFFFLTKPEAEATITAFLEKQNKPEEIGKEDQFRIFDFTYEEEDEDEKKILVTLNKGDKITVERKREKVFSIEKWADWCIKERKTGRYLAGNFDAYKKLDGLTDSEVVGLCFTVDSSCMID